MAADNDASDLSTPDKHTKVGDFIRKTSIDELPQLVNILKGDMAIVGPRPALWNQYDLIDERDKYGANDVMPGLTGWAQVNGRNAVSWDDKFRMDVEYVQNISLRMDLKVLFTTVVKVFKRSDIIQDDQQTASLHIVRADMVSGMDSGLEETARRY